MMRSERSYPEIVSEYTHGVTVQQVSLDVKSDFCRNRRFHKNPDVGCGSFELSANGCSRGVESQLTVESVIQDLVVIPGK
jgi:hypothetical protein